jgi:hypothetical protein
MADERSGRGARSNPAQTGGEEKLRRDAQAPTKESAGARQASREDDQGVTTDVRNRAPNRMHPDRGRQ